MPLPISYLLASKLGVKPANQEEVEGGHRAGDAFGGSGMLNAIAPRASSLWTPA